MIVLHARQHIHPPVEELVLEVFPDAIILEASTDDLYTPWKDFRTYWGQDDLVYIEQHKLIRYTVKSEFVSCLEQWCIFPHELLVQGNWARHSIGVVRWRKEMQQAISVEELEAKHEELRPSPWCDKDDAPGVCWAHHETVILELGRKRGFEPHQHWPGVEHWHVYHGEGHDL